MFVVSLYVYQWRVEHQHFCCVVLSIYLSSFKSAPKSAVAEEVLASVESWSYTSTLFVLRCRKRMLYSFSTSINDFPAMSASGTLIADRRCLKK